MTGKLRGDFVYKLAFVVLNAIRDKGLLRASSFLPASLGLYMLKRVRMFHKFLRWRLSHKISEEACHLRNSICVKCPIVEVVEDGRYRHQRSWYCGGCGCTHNRWSELTLSKNTREKHECPRLQFPEQAEQLRQAKQAAAEHAATATLAPKKPKAGCKGCGGNGQGHALRGLQRYERNTGMVTTGVRGTP